MARQSKKGAAQSAASAESGGGMEASSATLGHPRMTKADAIRAALAAGFDGPQEGTAYIRKEFGLTIPPQHFSAVKSQLKKRGDAPRRRGRPKGSKLSPSGGYLAPPRPALPVGGDLIDALETIKPLIAQYGADRVKRIVDLMG